ncbi:sulfite exporter TauE/SafE family protein [Deinococcus peraridilitoris]|uniref:sulfite exporter TauE/SafE family protein n=1 Tax=Deinococcus peraridilitoris TaxID=432329 RepID=UPI00059D479C|nr:TSUP family transporter [Deinococcus peraridilitoris]
MPDPSVLLFALPLAFLAGFVDAIAGGGGIITIPTLYFMGLSPAQVVATNKLLAIFGGATASVQFWRKGHVDRALILRIAPVALLGSTLGARLVLGFDDDELFRNIIAALILLVGVLVVTNRKLGLSGRYEGLTHRTFLIALPAMFAIGVYDGFFGPGTGTFLMFVFVRFLYFDFVTGSGNARVINFLTNLAAFLAFLLSGAMVWWIGLPMGIANALGAALGARMAILRGSTFVRVVYLGIVLLVVVRLLTAG